MLTPDFYTAIPTLKLRDPLAEFLGACSGGVIEYSYLDVVKLAGHSCPTVACTYWITHQALKALYGDEMPERGTIHVEFHNDPLSGVTGVIANVISMLTGATLDTGFKGLAGRFDRRNLLAFNADIPLELRYTRLDLGHYVDAATYPQKVAAHPDTSRLMHLNLSHQASSEEAQRFGQLWQDRVRRLLLDHGNDPEVFVIRQQTQEH